MSLPKDPPPRVPPRARPARSASMASKRSHPILLHQAPERKSSEPRGIRPPPVPTTPRPVVAGFSGEQASDDLDYHYVDTREMLPPPPPQSGASSREGMSVNKMMLCSVLAGREDEQFTLSELAERYSKYFPFRVRVEKGFYTPRVEIAADEMYNIHFRKRTKVTVITDCVGDEYVIPFNSAVQFGLVYENAKKQTTFETAGDVMSAEPPPKIITATRLYRAHDEKCSIDENEILVVKEVHKPKIRGSSRMTLRVYSVTDKTEKTLNKDCNGGFSAEPYYTRLHLPELLAYVPKLLPASAKLYLDTESNESLPSHMLSNVVTLKRVFTESSLIATEWTAGMEDGEEDTDSDDEESRPHSVVDIPLSLDIEVVIIPPTESHVDKLYMDTRDLYRGFNPSKTTILKDSPFAAQSHFYNAIREGHETDGMDLEVPTLAYGTQSEIPAAHDDAGEELDEYEDINFLSHPPRGPDPTSPLQPASHLTPVLPPRNPSNRHVRKPSPQPGRETAQPPTPPSYRRRQPSSISSNEAAVTTPSPLSERPPLPLPVVDEVASAIEHGIAGSGHLKRSLLALETRIQALEGTQQQHGTQIGGVTSDVARADISGLRQELSRLSAAVERLTQESSTMREEIEIVKQTVAQVPFSGQVPATNGVVDAFSKEEHNRQGLCSLNNMQIATLLELMGMREYQDTFSQHAIDGEILADCDDEILQQELHVSSKLHRLKLKKIITGRHSATNILDGQNPYVSFDRSQ